MKLLTSKKTVESQFDRDVATYREVLQGDTVQPPADLLQDFPANASPTEVDKARYTSPDFHRLELERMWSRVWQVACLADDIPEPGDVTTYEIGDNSFIIARAVDGEIKAFYNSCMHRGMRLCGGTTHLREIRCPFHGFAWNLDGSLKYVPSRWDFPQVTEAEHSLRQVRVGLWGGFVFINMDPDAISLEEYLGEVPAHFSGFCDMDRKYVHARYRRILPCNWKVGIEAFIESYHSGETHPQSLPFSADANTQYDILSKHTSRFMQSIGIQSHNVDEILSEQEMANLLFEGAGAEAPTLAPQDTARGVLARMTRDHAQSMADRDYSTCSESELVDAIQYSIFPNIVLFRGFAFPVGYRFRPNGHDPDTCIFDFMIFRDLPSDERPDEIADWVDVGDRSFGEALVELGPELRMIYDQDIQNMAMQQKGLKTGGKPTVSLSDYQEVRIRHLHETLGEYVGTA